MGLYKYDNNSYDIYEKEAKLNIQTENLVIPSGSSHVFRIDTEVGYTNAGLYKLSIIDGLDEEADSYNFNNRVIMIIKEIYIDSNGAEHTVHKLINLGGYVKEKGKTVDIKHLTPMYCGQLSSIGGAIYNYSDYDITIKDFSFFKDMQYSSAFVSGDFTEVPKQQINKTEPEDTGDGTETLVFDNGYSKIYKLNDLEYWYTTSKWLVTLKESNGSTFVTKPWTAFDDKGNLLGRSSDENLGLVGYTEYILFYYNISMQNITTNSPDAIIYLNNLNRKYGGKADTYHYTFHEGLNITMDPFSHFEQQNLDEFMKYDNSAGVLTFEMKIWEGQTLKKTDYIYFSPQPFYSIYAMNRRLPTPSMIDGHLCWFMESFSQGSSAAGEEIVKSSVIYTIDMQKDVYDSYTDRWGEILPEYYEVVFGEYIKQLTFKDVALEVKYPDGNLNN